VRCLVVDDVALNRRAIMASLAVALPNNSSFQEAETGEAALEAVRGDSTFDLVTVDYNMHLAGGVLTGAVAVAEIRALRGAGDAGGPCIVGVTAAGDVSGDADIVALRSAGCDLVWGKPLPDTATIQRDLFGSEGRESSSESDRKSLPSSSLTSSGPSSETVDLHQAYSSFGTEAPVVLSDFVLALDVGATAKSAPLSHELDGLADQMHGYQGSAATLGLTGLAELMTQMEQACRSMASQVKTFRSEFDPLLAEATAVIASLALEARSGEKTPPSRSSRSPSPPRGPPIVVLVVDDQPIIRMAVSRVLGKSGLAAVPLSHGREAVEFLKSGQHVDAALVDYTMPDLDGVATCRLIRAFESTIVVYGMSGSVTETLVTKFYDAGAKGVFTKPVTERNVAAVKAAVAGARVTLG